ncbi:hypothetical protein JCM39194_20280 [Desulfotomaculum varum]
MRSCANKQQPPAQTTAKQAQSPGATVADQKRKTRRLNAGPNLLWLAVGAALGGVVG